MVQIGATSDILNKEKSQAVVTTCRFRCYKRARQDSNLQPSDSKSEAVNLQLPTNKPLTESEESVLASCLAQIVQKYPELEQIIKVWPELPEHIKAAVKALVQTHKKENRK